MNTPPTGNRPQTTGNTGSAIPPASIPYAAPTSAIPMNVPVSLAPEQMEAADRTIVDTTDADALLGDAQRRQKIENELRALGMSPLEVQRLLNADSRTFDADADAPPSAAPSVSASPLPPAFVPPAAPAPKPNNARANMQSMQALAAELMAQKAAAQVQAVREVSLDLPPFRESSMQEVRNAEPLLRDASMLRRKEKYREAEVKVREALQFVPKDAAALELLGDVLQGVARVAEAMAVYKRALDADPKRSSAERKYGELLVLQQNWNAGDPEAMRGSSRLGLILSLVLPGLGQFNNREPVKGSFFLALDALCIYLLFFSPFGLKDKHTLTASLIACIVLLLAVYVTAFVDTKNSVPSEGRNHSGRGWDL